MSRFRSDTDAAAVEFAFALVPMSFILMGVMVVLPTPSATIDRHHF